MVWLLKGTTTDDIETGALIGGILYTGKDPVPQISAAIKAAHSDTYVNVDNLNVEDVIELLNAGAKAVVVNGIENYEKLVQGDVPSQRIIVSGGNPEDIVTHLKVNGVLVDTAEKAQAIEKVAYKSLTNSGSLPRVYCVADNLDAQLDGFISRLQTDRADGLYVTIVTDAGHRALGVCYSSKESIIEAVKTRTGIYQSRSRGLWHKGASSGATQQLLSVHSDCDRDALNFVVDQSAPGFCHNNTPSCFGLGEVHGLLKLERTIEARINNASEGSYTRRLLDEPGLLDCKIKEEAEELCEAENLYDVAWEAADLFYFVLVKLAKKGLSLKEVERNLDQKSKKVTRRKGDAKPKFLAQAAERLTAAAKGLAASVTSSAESEPAKITENDTGKINMQVVDSSNQEDVATALKRPAQSSNAFDLAEPIVENVRARGDIALLEYTAKFEKAELLSPVLTAPFDPKLMQIEPELKESIDLACANVEKFHEAQIVDTLKVETSPGVICSRFSRPIARVGLYVPGGTAILPSTAIHLGIPAKVAGCKFISLATPPRADGTPSPEVMYVAHKIGASQVVLAGGAQAVAAMAYGTESVAKVDKILGPGNQFVTAAKMICSTDVNAQVSIDMPAGPSEVLVVADKNANKEYVASDLLSQAEHGADSQVILISIDWSAKDIAEMQDAVHRQATALPRCDIIRKSIAHSSIINVDSIEEALDLSNIYAPEHLILQVDNASSVVDLVNNAGSVFVGALSPESCGDYTSGTNHTLPTYGYANQYSGVNTDSYLKYITSQELTPEGLQNIGQATVRIAEREGLQGHANAVKVRLAKQ
ncbi:trifunctional histidinol dehydrogenase/phosphoribosyl-AMP cyclohydrolase/phosphoribosyl-ATP diphosphatase [Starmerella bacillaris]|uniref:Histidine biosynthesis trifunctional protein n=1 Tax=Starmerella bacillaris TaxID=1247836 RepID=A0AAV5RM09_STABA|nr:trifunctional histidinol dehydrogenase/phosphoribosyl-AMP cyclohydrolase/phosphoribosyl-ATP diphosphatase [Starmerella bacillaris]